MEAGLLLSPPCHLLLSTRRTELLRTCVAVFFCAQGDGNLVLYGGSAIWATNTSGQHSGPYTTTITSDGVLGVAGVDGDKISVLWTGGDRAIGAVRGTLTVQDDGNVVLSILVSTQLDSLQGVHTLDRGSACTLILALCWEWPDSWLVACMRLTPS